MAEVLLFHHAQGQTPGFHTFADELRRAGHIVHTPDLHDGRTFQTLNDGLAHAQEIGFGKIIERGERAANELPRATYFAPTRSLCRARVGVDAAVVLAGPALLAPLHAATTTHAGMIETAAVKRRTNRRARRQRRGRDTA